MTYLVSIIQLTDVFHQGLDKLAPSLTLWTSLLNYSSVVVFYICFKMLKLSYDLKLILSSYFIKIDINYYVYYIVNEIILYVV